MLNTDSTTTKTTNKSSLPLTSAQKQADNFLITRNFAAKIAEEMREEEKNQKFSAQEKDALIAASRGQKGITNGKYTISSPSGEHHTFKISTIINTKSPLFGKRIISLMDGCNNQTDFTMIGFFDSMKGISLTKKGIAFLEERNQMLKARGKKPLDLQKFTVFIFDMLQKGKKYQQFVAMGCKLQVSKNCIVCNRELTNPGAINMGIGDKCYSDLHG